MKALQLLLFLACSAASVLAQNYSVIFWGQTYPTNEYYRAAGAPYYWPAQVLEIGTNAVSTNGLVMTSAVLANCYLTNQAQWNTAASNAPALWAGIYAADMARLVALYNQIPTGRSLVSTDLASITNIDGSLASGTNTLAQTVVRIRQLNGIANDLANIQSAILELLQRLGPPLRALYQPDQDTTQ